MMKSTFASKLFPLIAVAAALCFGFRAQAEPPRDELVHAFHLLKQANHDYNGHRMNAMKEVEAAGKELGLNMGGDLQGGESQWKSDRQLAEARTLLRNARHKLERSDRERVAEHLDHAIREIDQALRTK